MPLPHLRELKRGPGLTMIRLVAALEQRADLVCRALEQATEGIWLIDAEGRTTAVNAALARMLGYTPEQMSGRPFWDFAPDTMHAFAQDNLHRRHRGISEVHDFDLLHRDGSLVPTRMSTSPLYDGGGVVVGALASVTDLRQHSAWEEASRSALYRFERIAEKTSDCLWCLRVAPDGAQRFDYVSPGFERIWGLPKAALEAEPALWWSTILDEDRPAALEAFERAQRRGTHTASYRVRRPDGEVRWVENQMSLELSLEDGTRVLDGIARDITQRRELERRVQQMQRHESLSVMAAGIAHDFNNLLTAILGHAGLLRVDPPEDADELGAQLREIERAGERAAHLCQQLLAYAGAMQQAHRPTDLSGLVRGLGPLLDAVVPAQARISLDLASDLPPVNVDPQQLEQVLSNIVQNAAEAMATQPERLVRISTGHTELVGAQTRTSGLADPLPEGPYVFFRVEDTGEGMNEATLARIFEPFFTTRFTGRGLGLASVLGIVRGHRGGVHVESQPGRGTTVTVYLPAVLTAPPPPPRAPSREATGARRVLLVDDDPLVATVARRLLERMGYRVVHAANGREALDVWEHDPGPWAAVLVDLTMPGLSGAQTVEAMDRTREVPPLVVMSGYSQAIADARLGSGLPPHRFLAKPFDAQSLKAALDAAMRSPLDE